MRVDTASPDMTTRGILSGKIRDVCSFVLDNITSVIFSAPNGFIDGLGDSLWPEFQPWRPWSLRLCCYSAMAHHLAITRRAMDKANGKFYHNMTGSAPVPSTNVAAAPLRKSKTDPAPSSAREDTGCLAHMVYMNFEYGKLDVSQILRPDLMSMMSPSYWETGMPLRYPSFTNRRLVCVRRMLSCIVPCGVVPFVLGKVVPFPARWGPAEIITAPIA